MGKKQSHVQVRGPKGRFIPDTKKNRANKRNTIEHVPNPGRGDTGRGKKAKRSR